MLFCSLIKKPRRGKRRAEREEGGRWSGRDNNKVQGEKGRIRQMRIFPRRAAALQISVRLNLVGAGGCTQSSYAARHTVRRKRLELVTVQLQQAPF